ncbi:hypothetical protein ACEPAH_4062 [Sanghuangporus vaninii]
MASRDSCGRVYEVTLPVTKRFSTVDVDTLDDGKTRTFFCEEIAVKKILLSLGLPEVRACTGILRGLESGVVLRHELILTLIEQLRR